ncbi:hypothetical protein AVEN_146082-1, partial [Araneus ventricosus]
ILCPEEIEELLQNSDLSDISDDGDDGWPLIVNEEDIDSSDSSSDEDHSTTQSSSNTSVTEEINGKKKIERLVWKKKKMTQKTSCFQDDVSDVSEPLSPLASFFEYLNEEFFEEVAAQTNLYSVQQSLKSMNTNAKKIIRLVGLHVWMGTLKFPQAKLYWSRNLSLECFSEAMTRDRFFTLRQNLHFVDNLAPHNDNDKLWKVQPFLKAIKEKCLSLPHPKQISLDEQMIPFTG